MKPSSVAFRAVFSASLCLLAVVSTLAAAAPQNQEKKPPELPAELRGAKVYSFPDDKKSARPAEDPVIYNRFSYRGINFDGLALNLYLSIKPVERSASIRKIYFQDVRVNGVPVHIATFEQEFKLSKSEIVNLPAPLKCEIVFSELDSLKPVKEIVDQDKIRVSGQSFIEVKLNALEKAALRTKQLVLPLKLDEEVPLNMFVGTPPLLQAAVSKILETLLDPSTAAAAALAKAHLASLAEQRAFGSVGRSSVFLLYCEYQLRDPKTQSGEKFTQFGTGFAVSAGGKLLTAKRVVQPWKFDPQIAFLIKRYQLELDPASYKLWAWPAGAAVLAADGQLNFQAALSTDKQTLTLVKTAPDTMQDQEFQDSDSAEKAVVSVHASGENDAALLQLVGNGFQPLAIADPAPQLGPGLKIMLVSFPYGLTQPRADPRTVPITASTSGSLITLERLLNPGESGAPLLTPEGKVIAMAGGSHECVPIAVTRNLIQ